MRSIEILEYFLTERISFFDDAFVFVCYPCVGECFAVAKEIGNFLKVVTILDAVINDLSGFCREIGKNKTVEAFFDGVLTLDLGIDF